jgi:hypothetical protein
LDVALGERNEFQRQLELLRITHAQHLTFKAAPPTPRSSQRSLFLATLPKSGTEFVSGAIRDATELVSPMAQWDEDLVRAYFSGYCNREDIYSTGVFVSERLLLEPFRGLTHGYLCVSHCAATHHNLCVLRDAGFERVSVLVRDPRDSTVSWTYHLRAMDPPMIEFNSLIQQLPPAYFAWPHEAQLAFQVRTFLPAAVNWIESWVGAAAAGEQPVQLQIALFDELRSDPTALVESIFTFHGVEDYDLSNMRPPTPGERHFREGKSSGDAKTQNIKRAPFTGIFLVMVMRAHDWHPSRAFGRADGIKPGHGHAPLSDISVLIERDCVWSSVIPNAFAPAGFRLGPPTDRC